MKQGVLFSRSILIVTAMILSCSKDGPVGPSDSVTSMYEIAFVADTSYPSRYLLYLVGADGSKLRALSDSMDFALTPPIWSPDGARLAGLRSYPNPDLVVIAREGQPIVNVARTLHPGISWSADDQSIIYANDHQFAVPPAWRSYIVLWRVPMSGGPAVRITGDSINFTNPVVSPNGAMIACAGQDPSTYARRLYVMNIDGSNFRVVSSFESGNPSWSPNSEWLVYSGSQGLYKARPDGTSETQLLPVWAGGPTVSPSGSDIAYSSDGDIFLVKMDGSNARNITNSSNLFEGNPHWSPDGQQICFDAGGSNPSDAGIYVINSDGTGLHHIVKKQRCFVPTWSPIKVKP